MKPRNPHARALRDPLYKQRVVKDRRRLLREVAAEEAARIELEEAFEDERRLEESLRWPR
jgi:hypothetical protein